MSSQVRTNLNATIDSIETETGYLNAVVRGAMDSSAGVTVPPLQTGGSNQIIRTLARAIDEGSRGLSYLNRAYDNLSNVDRFRLNVIRRTYVGVTRGPTILLDATGNQLNPTTIRTNSDPQSTSKGYLIFCSLDNTVTPVPADPTSIWVVVSDYQATPGNATFVQCNLLRPSGGMTVGLQPQLTRQVSNTRIGISHTQMGIMGATVNYKVTILEI